MTKQDFAAHSFKDRSRRSLLQSTAALLSVPFVAKTTAAWAVEKLAGSGEVVVYSYGGSFTENVRRYVYEPFTKATGIKVIDVVADLSEPQIKAMNQAGRIDWDVAYLVSHNYPAMHQAGMFVPIDYNLWDQESLEGTPSHTRLEDAVVIFYSGVGLAYDQRTFPKGGPKNWGDFWDVKTFPGPRGFYGGSEPAPNIVSALLADGVAPKDVWPLSDDKLDRALKKLGEIKPYITKWWVAAGEPIQLLMNREYVMTNVHNGRALAAIRQGAPIRFSWEGASLGYTYAVILKGGPNTANAQKLIAFLNRAQIAAGWTQGTGYPGPNTNQLKYLPAELIPHLSISPENAPKTVLVDAAWLAAKRSDGKTNAGYMQERWLAWRS
ncbi:ABC transporter substrate-binding protein [Bradyrhizobium cajani]|uniref:Extracellular solute-binding protein n=1 Tax=Bradyrhizobium cajani TaxID=1928661 RepID=A0A844TDH7_9BRAD|nr:ABC transporter substrate-binding protein [Bradyrhizobium cajani]MCP3371804.1 ABC transporter substrate-binding protein [Bradyrhizobium cajani]MVT76376.1 extracellular solute-binding protein [Bradyrhizobium cajani]